MLVTNTTFVPLFLRWGELVEKYRSSFASLSYSYLHVITPLPAFCMMSTGNERPDFEYNALEFYYVAGVQETG